MRTVLTQRAKAITCAALRSVPINLWQGMFPRDVIALNYHIVSDQRLDHLRFYRYKNRKQFANDIAFVRERTVSYAQVSAHRLGNAPLAANSVMITIDDGFVECYDVIRPILLRLGVDATFFVTSDFMSQNVPFFECTLSLCITRVEAMSRTEVNATVTSVDFRSESERWSHKRMERASSRLSKLPMAAIESPERRLLLSWLLGLGADDGVEIDRACELLGVDARAYYNSRQIFMSPAQVRRIATEGFTVGAHGLRHSPLEGRTHLEIENEIVESCRAIREVTGQMRVPFAIPYGGRNIDRAALGDIKSRHGDLVDLIFDSGGFKRDASFVVNRVSADAHQNAQSTNVPSILQGAWSKPSAWWLYSGA